MFDFSNGLQSFALQYCSNTHSIKLYMSIEIIVNDVHKHCLHQAKEPIAYVDCPLHHDKDCTPHIRLVDIEEKTLCKKLNQFICRGTYKLLLEPTNQTGKSISC